MAKVTIAELEERLAKVTTAAAEAQEAARIATEAAEKGAAALAEAIQSRGEAVAQVARLTEENRALSNRLRAYKGSATKARGEIEVLKRERSPEARPIGALAPVKDVERPARRAAFEAALRDGTVDLVFSDGKREIREIEPRITTGEHWREDARGFVLKPEAHPLLEPGDMARPEVRIVGIAALDEAGGQIGWQPLVEPIAVPRNGRVQLPAGTIRFNF